MTATVAHLVLITMIGLFRASDSREKIAVTGCVVAGVEPATFILSNAKKNPQDPDEASVNYRLVPAPGLKLDHHLELVVRVSGAVARESDSAAKRADSLPRLLAEQLKSESGSCPAATESAGEDKSESDEAAAPSGGRIGFSQLGAAGMSGSGLAFGPAMFIPVNSVSQASIGDGLFGSIGGATTSQMTGSLSSRQTTSGGSAAGLGSVSGAAGSSTGAAFDPSSGVASTAPPAGLLPTLTAVNTSTVGPAVAVSGAAAALGVSITNVSSFSLNPNSSGPTPIPNPEPGTLVLLGTALSFAAYYGRKRIKITTPAA